MDDYVNAVRDYQSARDWLLLFVSSWMIMLMLCVTTSLRVTGLLLFVSS